MDNFINELKLDPTVKKLAKQANVGQDEMDDLVEFIARTIKVGRSLSHGMFMATCAVHKRLEDGFMIRDEIENQVMVWMRDNLGPILMHPGEKREEYMRDLVLFTRDITQDALGVT